MEHAIASQSASARAHTAGSTVVAAASTACANDRVVESQWSSSKISEARGKDDKIARVDSDASVEDLIFREAVRLRSVASSASLQKSNSTSAQQVPDNYELSGGTVLHGHLSAGGSGGVVSSFTGHFAGPGLVQPIWGSVGLAELPHSGAAHSSGPVPGQNEGSAWGGEFSMPPISHSRSASAHAHSKSQATSSAALTGAAFSSSGSASSRDTKPQIRGHASGDYSRESHPRPEAETVPMFAQPVNLCAGGRYPPQDAMKSAHVEGSGSTLEMAPPTVYDYVPARGSPPVLDDLQYPPPDAVYANVQAVGAISAAYMDAYVGTYNGAIGANMNVSHGSLREVSGRVIELAKDQHGCRFLQTQLEAGRVEARDFVFDEVRGHFAELAIDPFGNYLCQKLFESCSDSQRMELIRRSEAKFAQISANMHGTRAVQRIVDCLSTQEHVDAIVEALKPAAVMLMKDVNGNHVIQRCLHRLTPANNQFVYDAVTSNLVDLATHRHGCCVIQRCMDHASGYQRGQVVEEVTRNALALVQNAFGNYVVQYVLDLAEPAYTLQVIKQLCGSLSVLSVQKFSSNVIEKCLEQAPPDVRAALIDELIASEELVGQLLFDAYGNYVIQRALTVAQSPQLEVLCEAIYPHLAALRSSPYGKRIQTKIMKRMPRHALHSAAAAGFPQGGNSSSTAAHLFAAPCTVAHSPPPPVVPHQQHLLQLQRIAVCEPLRENANPDAASHLFRGPHAHEPPPNGADPASIGIDQVRLYERDDGDVLLAGMMNGMTMQAPSHAALPSENLPSAFTNASVEYKRSGVDWLSFSTASSMNVVSEQRTGATPARDSAAYDAAAVSLQHGTRSAFEPHSMRSSR